MTTIETTYKAAFATLLTDHRNREHEQMWETIVSDMLEKSDYSKVELDDQFRCMSLTEVGVISEDLDQITAFASELDNFIANADWVFDYNVKNAKNK